MKAIINNGSFILKDPSQKIYDYFQALCYYKDKAAAYSAARLSKSYYLRNSSYIGTPQRQNVLNEITKIKSKIHNQIMIRKEGQCWEIPSGLAQHLFQFPGIEIIDNRKQTGATIPLPWAKKPYDLRSYQEEAVSLMENNCRGIINLGTGLGKTLLAVHAIKRIKKKTLVLAPSEFIANQFESQLIKAFGDSKVGYYGGGVKKPNKPITIGIVNSVYNDIEIFKDLDFGLTIFDETHKVGADTIFAIAEGLSYVGKMFGLTATNYRNDGKDLLIEAACGPTLIEKDIVWGIDNKWLVPPKFTMKMLPTMEDFKDNKDKNYKANILNNDVANTVFISDIKEQLANGRHVLCLVDQVAHGKLLAEACGLPFVTGQDKDSQKYIDLFNTGKVQGLIATDSKIGEGADLPAIDCLIFANFVASMVSVMQCLGRGLRLFPGKKDCLVLDYTFTSCPMLKRHSLMRLGYYKQITKDIRII